MRPLEKLFTPIRIGSMEVKNRIVMAPMTTNWAPDDGTISQKMIDYWEERAKGGVGLIIFEAVTIDAAFPYIIRTVGLWDDNLIPSFKRFVDAMHAHGAKVAPQISHPGPESFSWLKGVQPVGPSPVVCKTHGQVCRELTLEEIKTIVGQYGEAARRAREAGCDAMELHAAHSYMLAGSFLSPLRNKRTDAYGGTIDGRLRFLREVMESIRAKAGPDFPVILRISGDEHLPGGRDILDSQYIAPKLVAAGVDAFHISGGVVPDVFWRILPCLGTPPGLNVPAAAAVKEAVDVPVMVVGRINDPQLAEDILVKGYADMVVMGRALLADPELPNKAREGSIEDIAPCTSCGQGCLRTQLTYEPMTCVINPAVGREKEMVITPAAKQKKVLVIGGGPGGLEAARVSALRGHKVMLWEKASKLGGQINLAAIPPMKQELSKWIIYLSTQVKKAQVKVELNKEATPELIEKEKPDVVIVATGGKPLTPAIPGVEGKKVVTANEVLEGKLAISRGKVLIIGGGMAGCEIADMLADTGYNQTTGSVPVTIVEMLADIGLDVIPQTRMLLLPRLREKGVEVITSATVREFLEDGVIIIKDGQEETIRGMDFIILACGTESVDELSAKIKDKVPEVYVIGDAKAPRKALEAIAEAAEIAREI
ncbi:MAG: FAD-dependent oxidoreductase [Desulfobacteraceae bacterium]|nr:FAD-dependent oxidoreductase [Desulfobacteraceae bacterium]